MKYLKSIHSLLLESVESYEWEKVSDGVKKTIYAFEDTIGNKYLVEIKKVNPLNQKSLKNEYEITYYVSDKGVYTVSKLVNVNPYKTIQTVLGDILKDFLKNRPEVEKISMTGLSKDLERSYISQRTKLYLRYLERNPIEGYRISSGGNNIYVIKNN